MNRLYKTNKINSFFSLGLLAALLLWSSTAFSQKKRKDTLDTEIIRVVKPYTPSVSDAFKIKQEPTVDSLSLKIKKEVSYTIHSMPVASTFVPDKGGARLLLNQPPERYYNNFVAAGFGNYMTPFVEVFAKYDLTNYSEIGGFINYQASFKNMEDVVLNSTYSDISGDFFYKQTEKYFEWKIKTGVKNRVVNWYGLPDNISFNENVIGSIDEKQSYGTIYLGGDIEFYDALVHNGTVKFTRFFDNHNSDENHFEFKGNVELPIGNELINTDVTLEYLNGSFTRNFTRDASIQHNFASIGISPSFLLLRDNFKLNIGGRVYYGFTDNENDESKFYFYPNVTTSYKISGDNFIAYAGVTGDLHQNSYEQFVAENPFVSPTLHIRRTDMPYQGFLGVKGKFARNFTFNIRGAYSNEIDKALFRLNPSWTDGTVLLDKGYEAGNSFDVVYDEVTTINGFAEVIFDFNERFKFGGNIEFNTYNLDEQAEAWNLPMLKSTLMARYAAKKWYANANVYFATDRNDVLEIIPGNSVYNIVNGTYFDVNIDGGFYFNESWSVFLKLNNILNTKYQKYSNFQVQGFQVLGGIEYRFDF